MAPTRQSTLILLGISLSVALFMPVPALAQDADLPSPLESLFACESLSEPMERLACFDAQVASLKTRESTREVVVIDAPAARQLKRESFGFSLPSLPKLKLPKLGGGDDGDGPEEVELKVAKVSTIGRKYVIEMENGQVWQQTSGRLNYIPRGDVTAIIEEAAMGSFRLKLTNGDETVRGLKVKRLK